ncbi:MAG: mono/diheme cytochrome c family protein [Planctomycetota bacterium]|jgi:mono/diheme cytochrome c family protein
MKLAALDTTVILNSESQDRGRSFQRGLGAAATAVVCALAIGSCGKDREDPKLASYSTGQDLAEYQSSQKERAEILDPLQVGIGQRIVDLAFTTIDGEEATMSSFAGGKPLLLIVRDVSCPVSMRIGPRTARAEKFAIESGAKVLYLNPCPHNTLEEIRTEQETYGFEAPYVHDRDTTIMQALDLHRTTEFLLYDEALTLAYRGAVDDQLGRGINSLAEPTHRFVEDALTAVSRGDLPEIQATTAPGCELAPEPAGAKAVAALDAMQGGPTYHRDIARLFQRRCVECHRPGGVAPVSIMLNTYEQVRGRRLMIRTVVEDDVMPPWFAAHDTGPWLRDRSLTPEEKAMLLAWIEADAPEGDPSEAPLSREFFEGWGIGEPDVTIALAEPFTVPAEGVVDLQELAAEHVTREDMWVTAMQILPTAPEVVHHVVILMKSPEPPLPKRVREELAPWQKRRGGWEFLGGYLPGKGPRVYPENAARFIPKGSVIQFVMHYTPSGREIADQTRIGFKTTDEIPDMVAQAYVMKNEDIAIPAGSQDVAVEDEWILPKDIRLISLTPHMHLRGSRFLVYVQEPGMEEERILELPRWDDAWQFSYSPPQPISFPKGTRFRVVGIYDNSPMNMNLAQGDWEQDVVNGPQVWDEMLMMAIEWVAPKTTIRRLQ